MNRWMVGRDSEKNSRAKLRAAKKALRSAKKAKKVRRQLRARLKEAGGKANTSTKRKRAK